MSESFSVAASSRTVWAVLTDYDRMHEFVSSMRRSRVVERREDSILLEQESSGGYYFFRRKVSVLLEVRETPYESIRFADLSGRDFHSYIGGWRIEESGGSATVHYDLEAVPNFSAPKFLADRAFRRAVRELLDQVRREIESRKNLPL